MLPPLSAVAAGCEGKCVERWSIKRPLSDRPRPAVTLEQEPEQTPGISPALQRIDSGLNLPRRAQAERYRHTVASERSIRFAMSTRGRNKR